MNNEITGALFKQMILHGAAAITAQKQAINDLNVFLYRTATRAPICP